MSSEAPVIRPARAVRCAGPAAIVLAAAALCVPARGEAQFSVQPVIVTMEAGASDAGAVVVVTNEGQSEMTYEFYLGDFDQVENGDHAFMEPGQHARSCVARLSVLPNGATLAPGERQQIQVRMRPGGETCWSVLFVESFVTTSSGARVGQRIAVKLYGVAPGLEPAGELTRAEVSADGRALELEFRNDGRGPLRPQGTVEIRTLAGAVVRTVGVEPFSVLPERTRRLAVSFGELLPAGRYVAVPILDFGGDYLAGGQALFEIRPEPGR